LDGGNATRILSFDLAPNGAANITIKNLSFLNGFADPEAVSVLRRGGGFSLFTNGTNEVLVENNLFLGNYAKDGGALFVSTNGLTRLVNNLIIANGARTFAGAVTLASAESYIFNNTIVGNVTERLDLNTGGGICSADGLCIVQFTSGQTLVANNVLWDNGALDLEYRREGSGDGIIYLYNNDIGELSQFGPDIADGNLSVDPQFEGEFLGFGISPTSPLRDAGRNPPLLCTSPPSFPCNWRLPEFGVEGNERIQNDLVDIGAFEFNHADEFLFSDGFEDS